MEEEMRKGIVLLFIITGIIVFLIPPLQAEDSAPSANRNCPSCPSFGIQIFSEKKVAPPFSLKSLDGNRISLSDFKGKPVLLFFWMTWCSTCKEDMVLLEKFSIGKKEQLTILLLAIDGEREKKVRQIIKERKISLPVLLVLKEKIMEDYGIRGWVPQTFLIDREGVMVGKTIGQRDWTSPVAWSSLQEIFFLR
jgi:peroxiredoxin